MRIARGVQFVDSFRHSPNRALEALVHAIAACTCHRLLSQHDMMRRTCAESLVSPTRGGEDVRVGGEIAMSHGALV